MKKNKWFTVVIVLIILTLFSLVFSSCVSLLLLTEDVDIGNVAHVTINGVIQPYSGQDLFADFQSSTEIVRNIEKAGNDKTIKAILIEINSPGGTPVASYEIQEAIGLVNKTTVCWIREVGASGAYWAASACDTIVANPMSIVGSVGVLGSYLEFSGLLDDYNVSYQRLNGGIYKDIGSPMRKMTDEERVLLQQLIDDMHDMFLDSVVKNRGLEQYQLDQIKTGMYFLGTQGIDLGLVDVLGGKKEAITIIEDEINATVDLIAFRKEKSFLDVFGKVMSSHSYGLGKGIGDSFVKKELVSLR